MSDLYLILSCPPHGEIAPQTVAEHFGQSAAEVGMLLRNPIPRVWFADGDPEILKAKAKTLREAGAKVRLLKGGSLTVLSNRFDLHSFAFTPQGMKCTIESGRSAVVPFEWKAVTVSCRPAEETHGGAAGLLQAVRDVETRSFRSNASESTHHGGDGDPAFVDLYFMHLPKVWRFTIRAGLTEFKGLGDRMQPAMRQNTQALLDVISERFANVRHDDRLTSPPPPGTATVGGRAIWNVLEEIDPSLKTMDWYDLLSRLAFLSIA
jgi:hypothetical protein